MRTVATVVILVGLVACSTPSEEQATQQPAPAIDPLATTCGVEIRDDAREATAGALAAAGAYADAVPAILKLNLTGAVHAGTILFKGIDDRPIMSGVPAELRHLTRPIERAFRRIRDKTRVYSRTLMTLRNSAKECAKAAREVGDSCVESAAADTARSAAVTHRLVRSRLEAVQGRTLQQASTELEGASLRVEISSTNLSRNLATLERCLLARG
ncbi:MAG: hypothetical protein M3285_02590 [Actinomycetota bacterium]|nr:hypothetical protein [Actinomycetota bacterium]